MDGNARVELKCLIIFFMFVGKIVLDRNSAKDFINQQYIPYPYRTLLLSQHCSIIVAIMSLLQ